MTDKFTVHHEFRQRWAWAVRWNGGKTICRCDSERDAQRIAETLNAQKRIAHYGH